MASKSTMPDLGQLSAEGLRALVAELLLQLQALREENAALKDEIARRKGLNDRPKPRPSGMEPATAAAARGKGRKTRRRGRDAKTSRRVVDEERVLTMAPPPGARFKGYTDYLVQELRLAPVVIRYRRERWRTADGRTLVSPLPAGTVGRFGPEHSGPDGRPLNRTIPELRIGSRLGAPWQRCRVPFMRPALAHVPKGRRTTVAAAIRHTVIRPDRAAAGQTRRRVADRLQTRWPSRRHGRMRPSATRRRLAQVRPGAAAGTPDAGRGRAARS